MYNMEYTYIYVPFFNLNVKSKRVLKSRKTIATNVSVLLVSFFLLLVLSDPVRRCDGRKLALQLFLRFHEWD